MFKKILATIIATSLMLTPVTVLAEEAVADEPLTLSWDMFTSQEGAEELISAGSFVAFEEVPCQMWVPDVMTPTELTDEDKEAGYIGYFTTADGDSICAVQYVDMGEAMDTAAYKAYLAEMPEVSNIFDVVVNDLEAVAYDMTESDASCIAFPTADGHILELTFTPASDDDYSSVIAVMISSITDKME